ncbi:metallophosphoesterase family protein [Lichenifustis flavocetrariae]|uniref:Serine/threonine protein phosphatase n=1 Tax=Lichenifustis flavocetrariae TaxID=2949735 RepID=A0AA41YZG7_9HYPH|nr:metallophosphoesterase family protein [Lichenifustis flavocetrariae]MCW6507733.1 serine/threonine protein phosphatase [Lichenifustis flavocetrariae]
MTNVTYAIADLHGAFDLIELAMAQIERHAEAASAGSRTLIFLGDYIDRGSRSREIIERLMAGPRDGWRWVCLKGNHEAMMIEALRDPLDEELWIENGGEATLMSYSDDWLPGQVPDSHLAWVESLPLLHADQHRVFVHAAVDPTRPLDAQDEHALMWSRTGNALGHGDRFVVHGHTPHPQGPVRDGNSINLDTLAWKTGRLVVGVFDDDRAGGPVDLIEVLRR